VHTKTTNQTEQDYMYGMHPPFPRYPMFVPPHMQHMLQNTTQIDNPVQVETSAQRNDIPPWLASVLQDINNKLDIKLNNIEAKIEKQNQVWKNIDHILETQNKRLSKVENQLTTMNSLNENLKHSILNNKVNVQDLDKSVCEFRNKVFELSCQANSDFF
jgi:chromosome segregation ATPase